MCLLGQAVHCLCHAVEEERLRLLLAAMAIGVATSSSAFGTASVAKSSGKTGFSDWRSQSKKSPTGPRRHVVVIRRVSRNNRGAAM